MTDRTLGDKLRTISMKLTSLDRRISRIPRPPAPASLATVADVKLTARGSAQSGWLLCDGALYTEVAQPALFAAIGTTFNTGGEAAGEFRVPDLDATSLHPAMLYIIKA